MRCLTDNAEATSFVKTGSMSDSHNFRLNEIPVHLGIGARIIPQEPFIGEMDWSATNASTC